MRSFQQGHTLIPTHKKKAEVSLGFSPFKNNILPTGIERSVPKKLINNNHKSRQ